MNLYAAKIILDLAGFDPILHKQQEDELCNRLIDCIKNCSDPINCTLHIAVDNYQIIGRVD